MIRTTVYIQDLAPPSATTAQDEYKFHSEIERVSGELYRSGHYKSAALEAYIRVIEQVRDVSRIPDDGDSPMNKASRATSKRPSFSIKRSRSSKQSWSFSVRSGDYSRADVGTVLCSFLRRYAVPANVSISRTRRKGLLGSLDRILNI